MRRLNGHDVSALSMSAVVRAIERPAVQTEQMHDPAELLRRDRLAAQEEGYKEGMAKGLADANKEIGARSAKLESELRSKHQNAVRELDAARASLLVLMKNLESEIERLAMQAEDVAVEAAFSAVLKLLGERSVDRTLMRELCLHALASAEQAPTALRISQMDRDSIGDDWKDIILIADTRYAAGQCALETRLGHYETGLDVRLEALKRAFLEGLQDHRSAAP
jgi:flagellar assembly protein FliH